MLLILFGYAYVNAKEADDHTANTPLDRGAQP